MRMSAGITCSPTSAFGTATLLDYWVDYQLAMDRFTPDYDYTNLTTFYVDLVEYLVMAVRLYFFIREQQFRPIDRGKYDELVGIQAVLQKPA